MVWRPEMERPPAVWEYEVEGWLVWAGRTAADNDHLSLKVARNDEITIEEIAGMELDGIVVSPGPSRPENAGVTLDVIRHFGPETPILGVCLGHQSIGLVYGGEVVTVEPVHGKKSAVDHRGHGVFEGLPTPVEAGRYHSLAVARESMPDVLEVTVDSSVWCQQLQMRRPELLASLREALGADAPRDLWLRVG